MAKKVGGKSSTKRRKAIAPEVRRAILHEAGYRCAVPACRTILTIDLHHMVHVTDGGGDSADNLLALCRNCHGLHHIGEISQDSIRAWKFLLMALNEAFDRRAVDILLAMEQVQTVLCSGDGIGDFAPLIASGYVETPFFSGNLSGPHFGKHQITLIAKGRAFLDAWKKGDQVAAVNALRVTP